MNNKNLIISIALTLFVFSCDVFSEIIEVISGSHFRVNEFYPDETSASNACVERAATWGHNDSCHVVHTTEGSWWEAGWLSSGGVGSNQIPFHLLVFYFPIKCADGIPLNLDVGCANPNRNQVCLTNNPVNIATGSKFFQLTDYQHSNNSLLRLTRSYDSSDGKWLFSFSSRIFWQASRMRVIEESGRSISFGQVNGEWVTENAGNYSLALENGLWIYKNGTITKSYDAQNRLVTIQSPQYEDINIAYPSSGVALISSDSASISLVYQDHLSNVLSVSLPDGTTITYNYDTQGRLVQVDNRGQTEDYLYENPTFPTAITSVLGGDGNVYKEITYHPDGRVHTSALLNGADIKTFTYPQNNSTSVTNALEKETIYSFEEFWGEKKVSSVQGVATANCVGANKNYTYYPSGLLETKTDWKNNTTSYQYNTRNLESSRTEALGTLQERIITTEWHPTLNLRTKVTEPGKETNFIYDAQGRLLSQSSNELPLN